MAATDTNLYINEVLETATNSGDDKSYNLYGSDIMIATSALPDASGFFTAPAVYKNDVLQTLTTHYTVDQTNGAIDFLAAGVSADVITVTYTWREIAADLDSDFTQYDINEPINIQMSNDTNGRRQLTESYNKVQPYIVTLAFAIVDTDMVNLIRHIYNASTGTQTYTTFDIYRDSLPADSPDKFVQDLMIMADPARSAIPGTPCYYNLAFTAMQLEIAGT